MKTLLCILALAAAPTVALAGPNCHGGHDQQASMSCAEGYAWDDKTKACVPISS
jgi:hypothetical protein